MARRKELKNIAAGLYGSFISRNNDVAGYWGIGKLCLLAEKQQTSGVCINLLEDKMSPKCGEFNNLLSGYKEKLNKYLRSKDISESWVVSAEIHLNFKPEPPKKHIPITSWGSLFQLSVAIKDDRGKVHDISGYGYCAPHNVTKESKSAGKERF
ncbi:MAG: hypothetical protein L3J75_16185 [Methylococcaceae bacterium]|nr:hypothetical protein [Methylococcaceae bacterium]